MNTSINTDKTIKDSVNDGWVERMPKAWRPYLRLARYDRPIGFWLLGLPGWIGLAFAALSTGLVWGDLKYAALIAIGAIAMRGAGCTYNDIVDRDLDAQVKRTALRPLPAGSVSVRAAWIWLCAQCLIGLIVLAFFPRLSQIIALSSLGLVAAYPFMKRITFWPQAWLGLTFNWAVLVAYSAKTGHITPSLFLLYFGLVFWTIGYDTIYACQDIEDDAMIGVKSTARLFGDKVRLGVSTCYLACTALIAFAISLSPINGAIGRPAQKSISQSGETLYAFFPFIHPVVVVICLLIFGVHLLKQAAKFNPRSNDNSLAVFKSNRAAGLLLILGLLLPHLARLL